MESTATLDAWNLKVACSLKMISSMRRRLSFPARQPSLLQTLEDILTPPEGRSHNLDMMADILVAACRCPAPKPLGRILCGQVPLGLFEASVLPMDDGGTSSFSIHFSKPSCRLAPSRALLVGSNDQATAFRPARSAAQGKASETAGRSPGDAPRLVAVALRWAGRIRWAFARELRGVPGQRSPHATAEAY